MQRIGVVPTPNDSFSRHAPFIAFVALLFSAAFYVEVYLDDFTYILRNSRLLFQLFVGVTVIAFLKNVVGLRTFGTFAPAIVALAFLQAGPVFGTIISSFSEVRKPQAPPGGRYPPGRSPT